MIVAKPGTAAGPDGTAKQSGLGSVFLQPVDNATDSMSTSPYVGCD
jgi:hypothetical protein